MSAAKVAVAAPMAGLDGPEVDGDSEIKLMSSENESFRVSRRQSMLSGLLKTALESDEKADCIPLPSVSTVVLKHIVQYLWHHQGKAPKEIEKPLKSRKMVEVCPDPWDAQYIDQIGDADLKTLYDLILASNLMDIKPLMQLSCAKVGSIIKGKPLDDIPDLLDTDQTKAKAKGPAQTQPKPPTNPPTKAK